MKSKPATPQTRRFEGAIKSVLASQYPLTYTCICVTHCVNPMATNLELDDNLIAEVVKLGNFKSKKAAVTQALQEYIQRHKQAQILQLFGTIDYDEDYDYKQGRSRP